MLSKLLTEAIGQRAVWSKFCAGRILITVLSWPESGVPTGHCNLTSAGLCGGIWNIQSKETRMQMDNDKKSGKERRKNISTDEQRKKEDNRKED